MKQRKAAITALAVALALICALLGFVQSASAQVIPITTEEDYSMPQRTPEQTPEPTQKLDTATVPPQCIDTITYIEKYTCAGYKTDVIIWNEYQRVPAQTYVDGAKEDMGNQVDAIIEVNTDDIEIGRAHV